MNDDDEMVTLEVQMPRREVDKWADAGPGSPVGDAARRWMAAHDRPERREFRLYPNSEDYNGALTVAVEDLEPGDRVAGRVVESTRQWPRYFDVRWADQGGETSYAPGTLVVLDGER